MRPDAVRFRLGDSRDAPACVALLERIAAEDRWVRTEMPFDVAERTRSLAEAVENGHFFLVVAETGERIIGNVVGMIRGETVGIGMGVEAAYRGRGIGGALLDEAIAWSTRAEFNQLYLEVYAHNEAALALYRTRGFVESPPSYIETRRDGSEWETLRMRRAIGSEPAGAEDRSARI